MKKFRHNECSELDYRDSYEGIPFLSFITVMVNAALERNTQIMIHYLLRMSSRWTYKMVKWGGPFWVLLSVQTADSSLS